MKSSMKVEAFQYNSKVALQGEFTRYTLLRDQYTMNYGDSIPEMDLGEFLTEPPAMNDDIGDGDDSTVPSESDKERKRLWDEICHFRMRAIRDINELSRLQMNLSPFSTQQL